MTVTQQQLEALITQIAPQLDLHFNPDKANTGRKIGFLLCAFDFGERGSLAYISTATADGIATAIIELAEKLGASARIYDPSKAPTRGQS